ncbi:short-chain dehydrogenase/reductase SDR [Gautieria morchelliformis]|nr:short-chain dehydrogenase/reductase SDR [Gautieria morchelliformis]
MASTSTARRSIFVVAGIGNGTGTGVATAASLQHIARNPEHLKKTADEIKPTGCEASGKTTEAAAGFPVKAYTHDQLHSAFDAIKKHWPDADIRVGLFNAASGIWKGFLEITPEEIQEAVNVNVVGAFAFARETILAFKDLPLTSAGKRGTLLFTGATAALRGNKTTSAFAASKFGIRALSQSLNKEFGKQDIHVAHSVIDGQIFTDMLKAHSDEAWAQDEAVRLNPGSIANAYLFLANQDRSAWTWELDCRFLLLR